MLVVVVVVVVKSRPSAVMMFTLSPNVDGLLLHPQQRDIFKLTLYS
jgi:hypothetical protein